MDLCLILLAVWRILKFLHFHITNFMEKCLALTVRKIFKSLIWKIMLLDLDFLRLATSWFALYRERTDNKLTEMLFENTSCNVELEFANLFSNLLNGQLPSCLLDSKDKVFLYARNCLATGKENQHPLSFCQNEALAVGSYLIVRIPNLLK